MLKIVTRLLQLIFVVAIATIVVLLLFSPQKTTPFLDANNKLLPQSIAEIRTVNLNGVEQRLLIRGEDVRNPLLLHVHGGPGGADQATIRSSGKTIEDIFTVVYWDQRGAGASYNSSTNPDSLSLKKIVEDGVVLSELLSKEFDKEKIYLQGHSWGTLVSIHMISIAPDLFRAYFAIGQIANSKQAELLSYNHTLDAAQKAGDNKTLKALKKIGKPPYKEDQYWIDVVLVERGLMKPYEIPGEEQLFSLADIYKGFIFYPEYSIKDKWNALQGSKVSMQELWLEAINANLFKSHPNLSVPVYVFQGKHDKHTVTEVAKDYYQTVDAPHKEYFSFDNSAHWPHLREYEKYRSILKRILNGE